jgi:queuine tRNA-ribosyltransferase
MSQLEFLNFSQMSLRLPAFVPDGTYGVVRALDAQDLHAAGVQAVMMNTYHLMQRPGSSTIQAAGGLQPFSGWDGILFTDSGGFQAYSLIRQNAKFGSLGEDGISFKPEGSERKYLLTPEKCIRLQISYGSNLLFCLDDCTHIDDSQSEQELSVHRTITWANRCKKEYLKILERKKIKPEDRPLLFAIVQGGNSRELRRLCAEALLEIGFDGYGYGGWPLDNEGNLVEEMVGYTRELIPSQFPLHALGIGHPDYVVKSYQLGYDLFDSAMPTRDARHGRLYCFTEHTSTSKLSVKGRWEYIYITDKRHIKSNHPISAVCHCHTCQHYTLSYLHHLYKLKDSLYQRLATIHNLRFMNQLCERLQQTEDGKQ